MNDMENMRVFADQLWKYMVPKLDSKFASNVSYFRAQVVSNPGDGTLVIQRPVENGTLTLPCVDSVAHAQPGQQVVALVMGSMSNAIIVGDGKLNVPGGGGDAGIANFQAQPDGSLVITLTDGTTFTATPVINAFSNVKVGSTTISADNNADTLTLNAGGLVTLTGNATNGSVTIYVDPDHTHITVQVLDLVNADSYGPSDMVSFDADVSDVPLKKCVVNILPVQEGSGDPSPTNIREISGWTGANVHVSPTTAASGGNTYTVDWSDRAGTVYGGTLDVLTGTLTVDRRGYIFDGTENWSQKWSVPNRCFRLVVSGTQVRIRDDRASSHFANVSVTSSSTKVGYYAYNGTASAVYVQFRPNLTDIPDLASWKAWLAAQYQAGTPLTCWHTIATPEIYQFSPQIVTALLGTNNIWADCGTIAIDYGAFLSALDKAIEEHSDDDIRHITETDRETWDSKADFPHTHDASNIVSGILPAARGGTGNGNGYIQIGQKAGTTLGAKATAEGINTMATGNSSHSEGTETESSGAASHAEGAHTVAGGTGSHAEGNHTTTTVDYAHAEGGYTLAKGNYSHAEGYYTIAADLAQHVFGRYNVEDSQNIEIVGCGTSSARKNIRTLSEFGNEWIAGTLTQASDARLKDVQGSIPDLSSIRAVRFRWKNGDDKEHLGYLAQDVEGIAPYLVDVDSNGYKSLDYIALLTAKVEMLEREIEKLKGNTRN